MGLTGTIYEATLKGCVISKIINMDPSMKYQPSFSGKKGL